jgi:hypothetical protein
VFPVPFENLCHICRTDSLTLARSLTCVSHASSLCETRSPNPHCCFLRVSLTRSPSRFLSSRKRDFSGLVRDPYCALQRLTVTRITMRSTDVCQPSLKCGHPCLAGSGFLSKLSLRPHTRSRSLLRMTAHDLLTCASHETESSNLVRGMSVSRRSSRFGEHPCADLLPVYGIVFSSIQFRGCCASDVSVANSDRHRL